MRPDLLVLLVDDHRKRQRRATFTWVFINAVVWMCFGIYLLYKVTGIRF